MVGQRCTADVRRCLLAAGLAGAGTLLLCAPVRGQSVAAVAPAAGYQNSSARYIAPSGTVVGVSYANSGLYTPKPTRWASVGAAAELLGVSGLGGGGEPYRCSDDGRVVVGRWMENVNTGTPAMWGPTGSYTALPGPGTVSEANGVSADGSVVTGWSATSQGRWLLRWNDSGALTQQSAPIFVSGPCSPDGNTAIGTRYLGGSSAAIAKWTNTGGPNGTLQTLAAFPSTWSNIRNPTATTPASDAAVGLAYTVNNTYQSWIWRNGVISDMGLPAGATSISATGISGDGGLVVGTALLNAQTSAQHAEVWTAQTGWQEMGDWLGAQGISFPGWKFFRLNNVSADGRTLVGDGVSPAGQVRGFVVTVPAPGAGAVLLLGFSAAARRRPRRSAV